jgi:hypothetical protein
MLGVHAGRPRRDKALRLPSNPPTAAEIVAVVRIARNGLYGRPLRGLTPAFSRAALRIDRALALREAGP